MSRYYRDFFERVIVTYIETVLTLFLMSYSTDAIDMSNWKLLLWGGVGPAVSALKSFLATFRGDPDSASLAKGV